MASLERSQGAGPPDPMDNTALQPKMMLHGERERAVATALCPAACVAAGRLRRKAVLVLAICLSATTLLYSLGSLAALPQPALGSLPPAQAWPGLPASQRGTGDDLGATDGDLLEKPVMQQRGTVLMGPVDTPGCFPGVEGHVTCGTDVEGWSLGTPAAATASPLAAQTSPQWQPGSGHREGLRLGTAVAVTLSPAPWLDTGVPAPLAQLPQTMGDHSPGSWHHLALGSLHGTGPGLHDAVRAPAVTSAHGLGQPAGTTEPHSPTGMSEGTPCAQGKPAAWVPAASPSRLQPPSLPRAASSPSAAAALLEVVPTQLVSPEGAAGGAHVPSDAPACAGSAWTPTGTPSQSHSTADQFGGDQMLALGASPDHRTMPCRADLSLAASSKPPALVTASDLSSQTRAVTAVQAPNSMPASGQSTLSSFSDVQHGASVDGATMKSCNGQKEEARRSPGLPDLGMGEDHTAAPHLVPLLGVPSALPTERTASSTKMHPGAVWVHSAVTPEVLWDTESAGTLLHGEAALLGDTDLDKVARNGSGLPDTVLASLPSAALAHDVNHLQVLAPFLPTAESGGPAVTSGKQSDLSSPPARQTLTPTKAHPSPAQTRAPSAAGPAVPGVRSAAPDAIPEPGVTKVPCKDGAAMVDSPSPGAAGVTRGSLLGSPTQRLSLHPDLFLTTASADGPAGGHCQAVKVAEMSVLPGRVAVAEEAGHSEPRTALVGPTAAPVGPSGPTHASPGSAPPPCSKSPAPQHCSEAVHHTNTTSLPSPSYLMTSTGAGHVVSSPPSSWTPAGVTLDAQSMSSHSVTSQHPSRATEHLPAAAGEAFTPTELMMMGKPGSPGVKPPASHPPGLPSPAQPLPVHVLPLQFRLLGITYTETLSSRTSESYRELEEEVRLMLNQMLSTYETFLQANVLEFMNGSVVVRGEALFWGDAPAPTNSHLIRTVVTEASRGRSIFGWQLEPQSVQSSGFSLENLDPEKLSISLTVFQHGRSRTDSLKRLTSEVTSSLGALYNVRNFIITQLRNPSGVLEITGDLYLDTIVHADVGKILQALTALAASSVDLTSLSVEGARLHLQVYPVSFLIANRHFSEDLLDPLAIEPQELTRDLGDVVARALRDHRSFLQVVIRGFLPGSLICHGDVVFQHPAPTSLEVLETLVLSLGPNKALAGSDFQVDPYSLAVGEDTLEPPPPIPGFPDYAVAIMVVCGLCIITAPILLLVCLRTQRLGWWDVRVLWDRRDLEAGTQTFEMDNREFQSPSEQGTEDAPTLWQTDSA